MCYKASSVFSTHSSRKARLAWKAIFFAIVSYICETEYHHDSYFVTGMPDCYEKRNHSKHFVLWICPLRSLMFTILLCSHFNFQTPFCPCCPQTRLAHLIDRLVCAEVPRLACSGSELLSVTSEWPEVEWSLSMCVRLRTATTVTTTDKTDAEDIRAMHFYRSIFLAKHATTRERSDGSLKWQKNYSRSWLSFILSRWQKVSRAFIARGRIEGVRCR